MTIRTTRATHHVPAPTHHSRTFDRARALARLVPLWPAELADESIGGRRLILQKLRKALRQERRRGLGGHWAYDLGRHAALLRAFAAEATALAALIRQDIPAPHPARVESARRAALRPASAHAPRT